MAVRTRGRAKGDGSPTPDFEDNCSDACVGSRESVGSVSDGDDGAWSGSDDNDDRERSGDGPDDQGSDSDDGRNDSDHSEEAASVGGALKVAASFTPEARRLCAAASCAKDCLLDMETTVATLLRNFACMTRSEKHVSLMTAISILMVAATAKRQRGKGARARYAYHLPLLGEVCRDSFCAVYKISTPTLTVFRNRVTSGDLYPERHGLTSNSNANKIDSVWLVGWFEAFADKHGQIVPLRLRRQKTVNGELVKYVSKIPYKLLPSHYTWETLHQEMLAADDKPAETFLPSVSSFRRILQKRCPYVMIRSPRDNVCDDCVMLKNAMKTNATTSLTEQLGSHASRAKAMRYANEIILFDTD